MFVPPLFLYRDLKKNREKKNSEISILRKESTWISWTTCWEMWPPTTEGYFVKRRKRGRRRSRRPRRRQRLVSNLRFEEKSFGGIINFFLQIINIHNTWTLCHQKHSSLNGIKLRSFFIIFGMQKQRSSLCRLHVIYGCRWW